MCVHTCTGFVVLLVALSNMKIDHVPRRDRQQRYRLNYHRLRQCERRPLSYCLGPCASACNCSQSSDCPRSNPRCICSHCRANWKSCLLQGVVTAAVFAVFVGIAIVVVCRRQISIARDSKNWQIWESVPSSSGSNGSRVAVGCVPVYVCTGTVVTQFVSE